MAGGDDKANTDGVSADPSQGDFAHWDRARDAVLTLARERGVAKTFCPSEAARRMDAGDWRRHLKLIRAVAVDLADAGCLQGFRKGKPIDLREAKGVIRLGLPRDDPPEEGEPDTGEPEGETGP
ncbi:MAG: DUF3253 domain-containing protein [Alphaproteobacteria bacterium]